MARIQEFARNRNSGRASANDTNVAFKVCAGGEFPCVDKQLTSPASKPFWFFNLSGTFDKSIQTEAAKENF
jgi:hypothetical protein